MEISFDKAKDEANIQNRKLSFSDVINFDFETALIWHDTRMRYTEIRMVAIGYVTQRLHVLCFCETLNGIRVISFRKANPREVKKYESQIAQN
jgi:uncharacterized DUF497 family protein